jgi:autotransporter-associated beta strand protein
LSGTLKVITTQGDIGVLQGAVVEFNSDGAYLGSISGGGSLLKSSSGNVTLSGSNTFTGGTTVNLGSLIGTTDSIQGAILNNANVTFNQTTPGTYAGNMSGTGSVTKSGNVTFTGTNTYTGVTITT